MLYSGTSFVCVLCDRVVATLDPSLLSALSCVALLATLLDYLVPTVSTTVYSSSNWTGAKEKEFEDICVIIATGYIKATHQIMAFKNLKEASPKLVSSLLCIP